MGEQGLSVAELARMTGVTRITLNSIRQGTGNPTIANMMAVAKALGLEIEVVTEGMDTFLPYDMYKSGSVVERVHERMRDELQKQQEAVFIEGLRRKGYEFEGEAELVAFVKEHCRYAAHELGINRTYYAKGVPFLQVFTNDKSSAVKVEDMAVSVDMKCGEFRYL